MKILSQFVKVPRLFAVAAKRDIVRRFPLQQIRQLGRFVPVVEQLIERDFESPRQFFERLDRRHRVAVFDTRNITTQQTRPLLDVALREFVRLPQFTQTISNDHDGLFSRNASDGDGRSGYSSVPVFERLLVAMVPRIPDQLKARPPESLCVSIGRISA